MYETDPDGKNCVSFYSSRDARHWRFESRSSDLYECPDFFPLPAAETGERVWMLYGADGRVRFGDFRGYAFHENGESHPLDYGPGTYAGQTWNSHPDERCRYHIAWLHDPTESKSYNDPKKRGLAFQQSMTLLCRFELHRVNGALRLFRTPIEAISALRQGEGTALSPAGDAEAVLSVPGDCELTLGADKPFRLTVNGEGFSFDPADGLFRFTGGKSCTRLRDGDIRVRIVTDTRSIEFFLDGGLTATFADPQPRKTLRLEGAAACGRKWTLDSIWQENP